MNYLRIEDTLVLNRELCTLPSEGLICAHPGRVERIVAQLIDGARLHTNYRGYQLYVGQYKGVDLFIANTGIGAPAAAFLIEELVAFGAKRIIRVGTSDSTYRGAAIHLVERAGVPLGLARDLNIENTNLDMACSETLSTVIRNSASRFGTKLRRAIGEHVDSYHGVNFPGLCGSQANGAIGKRKFGKESERDVVRDMETGALYMIGELRDLEVASLLFSIPKHEGPREYTSREDFIVETRACEIALDALATKRRKLLRFDRQEVKASPF